MCHFLNNVFKPRYRTASENIMMARPPRIEKKLAISADMTDDIGRLASPNPANIQAK
jgi:hypothetical protein